MIIYYPDVVALPATRRPTSQDDRRKRLRMLIIIRNQHPREYDWLRIKHTWRTKGLSLPDHAHAEGFQ